MKLTVEQVKSDIRALPENYKTADIDRLIKTYIKESADASALEPHILEHQELHRIYYYVTLKQMKRVEERMEFLNGHLHLADWWHTDQLIGFVSELDFETALGYAGEYVRSEDPYIRRWGYVLFISKLGRQRAEELLPLTHNDDHYSVQMAQAWLIAELAVFQPEYVHQWLTACRLDYRVTGKAVQKICDSYRIADEWKARFRALRPMLKEK